MNENSEESSEIVNRFQMKLSLLIRYLSETVYLQVLNN